MSRRSSHKRLSSRSQECKCRQVPKIITQEVVKQVPRVQVQTCPEDHHTRGCQAGPKSASADRSRRSSHKRLSSRSQECKCRHVPKIITQEVVKQVPRVQ